MNLTFIGNSCPMRVGKYLFIGRHKPRFPSSFEAHPQIIRIIESGNRMTVVGEDFYYKPSDLVGRWFELPPHELESNLRLAREEAYENIIPHLHSEWADLSWCNKFRDFLERKAYPSASMYESTLDDIARAAKDLGLPITRNED